MNKQEIINKITQKREFSQLPKKDVELAFSHFEKREVSDEEKIKLTRELLHKVFGAFTSRKLLSPKNKNEEWILRKHLSTMERLPYYTEVYKRIFSGFEKNKEISIIDLGAGVNGISYKYLNNLNFKVNYIGVEAVGQLVSLMNNYFKEKKISGITYPESLFELEKIKKIILKTKKPRIIFLFKVLDSLEMLERDYSKKLLKEITPLADKVVISFATRSMIKRKRFLVNRNWILDFIKENFEILDDFEIGGERYLCFKKRD
ncbi:MAG TPA: hypothetical protein VJA20_03060 [Candidatus Nanoarchaeia archaeon]|nr:hypothetical protein [Candidatus Nanoarchaeia archaeon]